jgi:hypothetical protein
MGFCGNFNADMGFRGIYPLVNEQFANWNMPIEIVDLPIKNCDFP